MPRSTTTERARRRHRLLELLSTGFMGTQEELVAKLAADGLKATQATVSRDLDDLGAVRLREGHRTVYALPERNGPPVGIAARAVAEWVTDVAVSANLVVVKTFPGMAPAVAAVLDQEHVPGVLGTVAGDDTVLVVADEATTGRGVAARLTELAEVGR